MAQLAVATAGAVVGSFFGVPQVGWAIGSVVGSLLFPTKQPDQEGPRLNDLTAQTSGYGVPIPIVAGRAKLAGNIIWATPIEERRTTRRQGKGGGGPKITSYSYFGSWAVGLCEWLTPPTNAGVLRLWLDNKLLYDATGATDVTAIPGLSWRFYPGSETQFPDPLIEATVGAANAPAHRGLAYIVFDDVPLDRFGNRIPNVVVELSADVIASFPEVPAVAPASVLWPSQPSTRVYLAAFQGFNVAVDFARGRIYEGRTRTTGATGTVADEAIRVYDLITMQGIAEYQYDQVIAPLVPPGSGLLQGNGCGLMHMGADGFLYVAGGTSTRVPIFKINPDTMRAVDFFGASVTGGNPTFTNTGADYLNAPILLTSFQVQRLAAEPLTFLAGHGSNGACYIINADRMEYVWGHVGCVDPVGIGGQGALVTGGQSAKLVPGMQDVDGTDVWVLVAPFTTSMTIQRVKVSSGALALTPNTAMGIRVTLEDTIDVQVEIDASATRVEVVGAFWDATDDSLVITISSTLISLVKARFTTFKWKDGSILWSRVNHVGAPADDARGEASRVLSGIWGRGGNLVLQPGTGDLLVNSAGAPWQQTVAWLDEQRAVVGWTASRALAKRYLVRSATTSLTVGQIVDALCQRAGLSGSDVNTAALTDPLRGYMLARPMSARDALTPLAAYSQADAVEQDDLLVFRKRGGAPVLTLPYADLLREDPDANVIEEQRAQDADLPATVTVRYADYDRGWEQGAQSWQRPKAPTATMTSRSVAAVDLPMPLTAAQAKAVARRICVATWRERTRMAASTGPRYLRLVPTDVVNLETRDGATIRCRVLSTQLGANWTTRIEAVTEDAAVYSLTAPAEGGSGWSEPQMPAPYFAQVVVPDLALVDDSDDLAQQGLREYAFVCSYSGAQFRGVTVIERAPGGPWEQAGVVTTPVEWGGLIETPPLPPTPWTWDEVGTLRLRMTQGEPESATENEVLNGANRAALVAADGTAEIVQWRTAVQEADGSWTLSGLLRGRRGTEDLIASRATGNLFIILDATRLLFDGAPAEVNTPRAFKAVTIFQTQDTAPSGPTKTRRGRAERPYAPAQVAGARDGSQNLTITWIRRTRTGGELLNGTGTVPLSEGAEVYEVDVMSGSTVVRTITGLTSPTASYTAAQQTTDFGAAQPSVTVRVFQISSIVGRGLPAEVTL
jgi:hypothetical protein